MSAEGIEPELAAKLLRAEYPDEMAARSCTCEPDAMCGAHRLLKRYEELYEQLRASNELHRMHRHRLEAELSRLRNGAAGVSLLGDGKPAGFPEGSEQP